MHDNHRDDLKAQNESVNRTVKNAIQPVGATLSTAAQFAATLGGRYWRRASSRAMGLIYNGLESVAGVIPGRT